MISPGVFFQSVDITEHLRSIALSQSQRTCVRLLHAERMASGQLATTAFRLSGRGVF